LSCEKEIKLEEDEISPRIVVLFSALGHPD